MNYFLRHLAYEASLHTDETEHIMSHTACSFKVQWHQMITFRSVQCHPALTYIFNF